MKRDSGEDGWWQFLELLSQLDSAEALNNFFGLFLTLEEKDGLADRYLIVRALLEGEQTQREIAEELQVSISKITRGSNGLKIIDEELRAFLLENIT